MRGRCTDRHLVCTRDSDSYECVFDNKSNSIECKQPAVYMIITMVQTTDTTTKLQNILYIFIRDIYGVKIIRLCIALIYTTQIDGHRYYIKIILCCWFWFLYGEQILTEMYRT